MLATELLEENETAMLHKTFIAGVSLERSALVLRTQWTFVILAA